MENLREDYNLVEQDLDKLNNKKEYNSHDIVDMIEISYLLASRDEMEKFNELLDISVDGINLFGVFVKFCYDIYFDKRYSDMSSFLNFELEECIDLFIKKYFYYKGEK